MRVTAFLVSRDLRTVTGRNVKLVEEEIGQDIWSASPGRVKQSLVENETVAVTFTCLPTLITSYNYDSNAKQQCNST